MDHYFLAVWPDDPVRHAIAQASERWLHDVQGRCRRVRARRYHLTLLFLGAITPDAAPVIARLEQQLHALDWVPFHMVLDQCGHFGSRVGWLGCSQPPAALLDLHERVRQAAEVAGLSASSAAASFAPHVTVARDARVAWPPATCIDPRISWEVRDYLLMRSEVSAAHAYREIGRFSCVTR